jgi:hypothetical protein
MPKNKDWGGVIVTFAGCTDSLESIFGTDDISPGILSRRLWAYIKAKDIKRPTRAKQSLGGVARLRPQAPVVPVATVIDDVRTYWKERFNHEPPETQRQGSHRSAG